MTTAKKATLYQGSAKAIEIQLTRDGAKPDVTGWTFSAQFGRERTFDLVSWDDSDFTVDDTPDDWVLVTLQIGSSDITTEPRSDYLLQVYADDGSQSEVLLSLTVDLKRNLAA